MFKTCRMCGHNLLLLFDELTKKQQHRLFMLMRNKVDLKKFLEAEKNTFTAFRFPQEYSQYDKLGVEIKTNILFLIKLNNSLESMYDNSVREETRIKKLMKSLTKKYNDIDY